MSRESDPVSSQQVPGGAVHELPADLREALLANPPALAAWSDITRLARNEFICWVEDAKQAKTRERRIRRTQEELEDGMRRPCCWPGCGSSRAQRQRVAVRAHSRARDVEMHDEPISNRRAAGLPRCEA